MDATDRRYSRTLRARWSWILLWSSLNELAPLCGCGRNDGSWRYAVRGRQRGGLLAVDGAVFHYEGNSLQGGDVVEGVAGDGDYIGRVAGLKDADFILPAQ